MSEWAWNDDVVEPVAPAIAPPALNRAYGSGGFGFDGEKFVGGYADDADNFADSLLQLDFYTLRQRSSELFETNLYARGIIKRLVTNEVNTGLSLEARPVELMLPGMTQEQLHDWSDKVESYWAAYVDDPRVCDYSQQPDMTHGEQTASVRREALVGGDVLCVKRLGETGLPNVQLIGGHRVVQPLDIKVRKGHRVEYGVETDKRGRHVAYYVQPSEDFDAEPQRIKANAPDGTRLAWMVYGTDKRVGQTRGVPLLGIVLQSLKEVDKYRDSVQRKAVVNSLLAMWIEKSEDKLASLAFSNAAITTEEISQNTGTAVERKWREDTALPGIVMQEMQHGEKVHAHNSDGGEQSYPEFEAALINAVFWACEIPPEIGALSFNSNYSASQAALNEFKIYLGVMRKRIARDFNQPVYVAWLYAQVRRGVIQAPGLLEASIDVNLFELLHAWTNAAWIGAVKPVTDILKMVKAFEIMVDRGWTTNARIAQELTGTKFSTNARVLAREREEMPTPEAANGVASVTAYLNESLKNDLLSDPSEPANNP